MALCDMGRADDAETALRAAVAAAAGNADAWSDLGHALLAQGRAGSAAEAFREAAALRPGDAMAMSNLGAALVRLGRADEAEAVLRGAVAAAPDRAEPHSNLGNALLARGRAAAAEAAYRQAAALMPGYAPAHANLGAALLALGRADEAVAACRRAISLDPAHADAHGNLGNALLALGRAREAQASYRRAMALRPAHAAALVGLGNALRDEGRLREAVAAYRQAIGVRADDASAHANLGNALQDQGLLEEAIAAFRQALQLAPDDASVHSNLLMCLHYASGVTASDLHREALEFGRRHAAGVPTPPHANARDPTKRLRIGYVSADFRNHPVGYFLARALAARDRSDAEVICYAAHHAEDAMTARLRAAADVWRGIAALPDDEAAALIRGDGIDILVDLAGHTANNRLPLFARRPAPVQATWLGYFDTTGLAEIDWILADRHVVPEGEDGFYSERVWRLPDCYLCYAPHDLDIEPAPPPMLTTGAATFGCLNNRAKVTADTVALWAQVLRGAPGSCLFIKTKALGDAEVAARLTDAFVRSGISAERLILEGQSPLAEAMAAYRRVDIALDPFPFAGGTTTAEALWMGVPVVTLASDRWAGRIGSSLLATIGLGELVAPDEAAYARIAVALGADRARLAALHRDLRPTMAASPVCDGKRFAAALEAAYRGMWAAWCGKAG